MILDAAARRAPGKWTVQDAAELGAPVPTIAAVGRGARASRPSSARRVRGVEAAPGPIRRAPRRVDKKQLVADVRAALYAAKACSYAQGMNLLARRLARARLGPQPRRARAHLEGRLHHPRAVPRPDQGGVRPRPEARQPAARPGVPRGARPRGRTAGGASSRTARRRGPPAPGDGRVARLLRQHPPRAPAGEPDPGAARLLRRAHLRAPRPPGSFHTEWTKTG